MYTKDDEFDFVINDTTEYLTCISEYQYLDTDYLICENEDGIKRVFYYDLDDELTLVEDEEEEEVILDHYQEDTFKSEEKPFDFWEENDFSNYESFENEDVDQDLVDDDYIEIFEDDEDIDDFVDDLFNDED